MQGLMDSGGPGLSEDNPVGPQGSGWEAGIP
jgi:hypothetical protein